MTAQGWAQVSLYVAALLLLAKPLGSFMAAVYTGRRTFLSPAPRPVEALIYRLSGVDERRETDWRRYAFGVISFSLIGLVVVYLLQRWQGILPLNPESLPAVSPDSAFNTAVSS